MAPGAVNGGGLVAAPARPASGAAAGAGSGGGSQANGMSATATMRASGDASNGNEDTSSGGEQAMRAMEDLSLRMSKKVAQLTKVIYHLNTRNEEQVFDLQDMSEHYESEMEIILRDTAERINSFRQQAEQRAGEERAAAAVKELRTTTETRCLTLEAEFKLYRQRTEERIAVAKREAQARVDALVTEVETVKRGFKEQVQAMEDASSVARDSARASSGALDEAKEARKQHDELKTQLEKKSTELETAKRAAAKAEDLHRREAERLHDQIGQLRDERERGMQDASSLECKLAAAEMEKREAENELRTVREELGIARATAETLSGGAEVAAARESLLASDLETARAMLSKEKESTSKLSSELLVAQDALKNSEGVIETLISKREELENELGQEKKSREVLEASAVRATASSSAEYKKLEQRANELQGKLSSLTLASESEIASLKATVASLERQIETKRANAVDAIALVSQREKESKDLQLKLDTAQTELASSRALQATTLEEVSRLKAQLGDLSVLLKQTKDDGAASAADESERLKEMYEKKMTQMRKDHVRQQNETLANHKDKVASICDEHAKKLAAREEALKQAMTEMKKEFDAERNTLAKGIENEKSLGDEKANKLRVEMKQKVAELLQRLADEEKQYELVMKESNAVRGEKDSIQNELADAKRECKRLISENAKTRADFHASADNWRQEREGQKEAYDTLRQLFDAEKKARLEDAAAAVVKKKGELEQHKAKWQARADERIAEAVKIREGELDVVLTDKMDILATKHDFDLNELKKHMHEELAKRDAALEEQVRTHADVLASLKGEHRDATDILMAEHASTLKDASDDHRIQVDVLRRDHEEEVQNMQRQHSNTLTSLREQHQMEVDEMKRSRLEAIAALETSWSTKFDSTVRDMEMAREDALESLKISTSEEHADVVASLNAESTARINDLEARADSLATDLTAATNTISERDARIVDLENAVDGLRNDVHAAGEDLESTVATMRVERVASETKLTEDYKAQIEQQRAEHLDTKTHLEDEIRRREADHDATINEMQDAYEMLEQRFENREPRPEDLERIAELEESIADANEKLGTQEERLRIMKVEMRNREESYNVKFANDPKVMNESMPWMKPKPRNTTGKADAGGSGTTTTSKRNASARTPRRASTMY